jgi:hypothetical protein
MMLSTFSLCKMHAIVSNLPRLPNRFGGSADDNMAA